MIKHFCDLCNKETIDSRIIVLNKDRVGSQRTYEVCLECSKKIKDYVEVTLKSNEEVASK